jgi:outer membrane protein assembly factor BamE
MDVFFLIKTMRQLFKFFILLMALMLVGCGSALPTFKPYKMDIQQGNVLTSEMLLQLRPGMTKSQVRFILGTPLLVDSFHSNRWDYFYQLRKQGEIVNQRRVILDFEDDLLLRVRGDVVPKGQTAEDLAKQLEAETVANKTVEPASVNEVDQDSMIIEPIEKPNVEVIESPTSANPTSTSEIQSFAEPASVDPAPVLPVESAIQSQSNTLIPEEVKKDDVVKEMASVDEKANESVSTEQAAVMPVEAVSERQSNSLVVERNEAVMQENATKTVEGITESVSEVQPSKSVITQRIMPVAPVSAGDGKKIVFRLDRQLDASRIVQSQEAEAVVKSDSSVTQDMKASEETLPENDNPSFFERMLEKIGF